MVPFSARIQRKLSSYSTSTLHAYWSRIKSAKDCAGVREAMTSLESWEFLRNRRGANPMLVALHQVPSLVWMEDLSPTERRLMGEVDASGQGWVEFLLSHQPRSLALISRGGGRLVRWMPMTENIRHVLWPGTPEQQQNWVRNLLLASQKDKGSLSLAYNLQNLMQPETVTKVTAEMKFLGQMAVVGSRLESKVEESVGDVPRL